MKSNDISELERHRLCPRRSPINNRVIGTRREAEIVVKAISGLPDPMAELQSAAVPDAAVSSVFSSEV